MQIYIIHIDNLYFNCEIGRPKSDVVLHNIYGGHGSVRDHITKSQMRSGASELYASHRTHLNPCCRERPSGYRCRGQS